MHRIAEVGITHHARVGQVGSTTICVAYCMYAVQHGTEVAHGNIVMQSRFSR